MKAKIMIAIFALLMPVSVFAANTLIEFMDNMITPWNENTRMQTFVPNPAYTILVADNNAHTITLADLVTAPTRLVYFNLFYGGTGTCYVRLMETTTVSSWPQYPISTLTNFNRGIHPNVIQLQYSSCFD